MSSKSKVIYWAVSLLIALPLLYISLRGIEWERVFAIIANADRPKMAAAFIMITMNLFLRSARWRLLLLAEGPVSRSTAFWATSAGYLGNNFLPARAGEVVRSMMVSSRAKLSRMYVLTTALAERVVDALVLVAVSAAVVLALPSKPTWLTEASKPFLLLGTLGVVAIAVLPYTQAMWLRLLQVGFLPDAVSQKLQSWMLNILRGIRGFHDIKRLVSFLFLTSLIWCLDAITVVMVAQGLDLFLDFRVAFLLIAGLGLGSAIPSTPGYVGVYQFIALTVLLPFGFGRDDAIAFILMFQALLYAVFGLWGVLALWYGRDRNKSMTEAPQPTCKDVSGTVA